MSSALRTDIFTISEFELLRKGRQVIDEEAHALDRLSKNLDVSFQVAVRKIAACEGAVVVTGVGKAGLIGRKIAATFSSLGIRSHFLHPVEAVHGDLGIVSSHDVILVFSNSGETEELLRLLPMLEARKLPVIAVTAHLESSLAKSAEIAIPLGRLREAGRLGLAPTTTTTAMLAVGDALALVVADTKGFEPQDFARFHPGGHLGRRLMTVQEVMRRGEQLRIAPESGTVRETLLIARRTGRRTGAMILVDTEGRLAGIFTDSDLSRLLEQRQDGCLDRPIREVMTRTPVTTLGTVHLEEVLSLMAERKLSELPVVDADNRPVGLVDITDVLTFAPALLAEVDWN